MAVQIELRGGHQIQRYRRLLVKRSLRILAQKWPAVFDHPGKDQVHRPSSQRGVVVEIADELAAEYPQVVNVFLDRLW